MEWRRFLKYHLFWNLLGFFGGHFITRLYLIGALRRADEGDRQVVGQRAGLTETQLRALDAAPLSLEKVGAEFDPVAKEAAAEIIKLPLESLSNWRDIRLWSKAQLSRADAESGKEPLEKAIQGYQKAIEIVRFDAETRMGYAVALAIKKSGWHILLEQLEAARSSLMLSSPRDLKKNVYKSLTFACLSLKTPESFSKTLQYAREYLAQPDSVDSEGLWVNIACAYGQCYAWLSEDEDRTVSCRDDLTLRTGPGHEIVPDIKA